MMSSNELAQALAAACPRDPYLANALSEYLTEARALTQADMDAYLAHFAATQAEQAKDNTIHHAPNGEALQRGLGLAQKLALQCTVDGGAPARTGWIIDIMLAICAMDDWVTQGKFERRFDADLCTGDTSAIMGLLYRQVKDACTPAQREIIARAIEAKGIRPIYDEWLSPFDHWHALDTMGHNWWLVIICGAGIAAMAIRDSLPDYDAYMAAIIQGCHQWFRYPGNVLQNKKANFGQDGDFIEFIGYLTYGLSNYAVMEDYHRALYGESALFEADTLAGLVNYYLVHYYTIEGAVYGVNFGDTSKQQTKHQHAAYYLMQRFGRGDFFYQHRRLSPGPNQWMDFQLYPGLFGLAEDPKVDAPLFSLYRDAGYATIRTGFGQEDTLLAVKTGESWNHNHLDVGTFILVAGGRELAVDSGTCSYGRPEYRSYYTTPRAHNVVLLDGHGEDADAFLSGTKYAGTFPASLHVPQRGFTYLLADCCGPYASIYPRFYRHILFLDGLILFVDDLQTHHDGELSWLMHYDGALTPDGDAWVLNVDGVQARLHALYPSGQRLDTHKAWRSEIHQGPGKGTLPESHSLSLSSPTQGCRAKLIEAIQLPGAALSLSTQADGTVIRVTIDRGGIIETVYCNTRADGSVMHKNSHITHGDIATDAFLVYTKEEQGQLTDVALVNGSYLKIAGRPVCGAMVKLDAHLHLPGRAYTAALGMDATVYLNGPQGVTIPKGNSTGNW